MKNIFFIAVILLLLFPVVLISAQQNPFLSSANKQEASKPEEETTQAKTLNNTLYNSGFMQKVKATQKKLQDKISSFLGEYKQDSRSSSLTTFLAFSFLYGLLHVLGPGHRKVFLFTYFLSRPAKIKQGMAAGFMTAVLHAFSAIIFVGGLYLITEKTLFRRFNDVNPVMEKISYGLIVLIGFYLIIHEVINLLKKTKQLEKQNKNPDTIIFVIASGMVPCPGAATIMIFSFAVGSPLIGIYSVLAMSLGMAAILTFIPLIAISLQNSLLPIVSKWKPETGKRLHSIVSIFAAILLILFGLFFLV